MTDSIEDFFAQAAGSGDFIPSYKFKGLNDKVSGEIVDVQVGHAIKFKTKDEILRDKNGAPIPQVVITLQTALRDWDGVAQIPSNKDDNGHETPKPASDDDGKRKLYVKYGSNVDALRQAVEESGAAIAALKTKGSKLAMKLSKLTPTEKGNDLQHFTFLFKAGEPELEDTFASAKPPAEEKPAETETFAASTPAPAAETAGFADDEPPF